MRYDSDQTHSGLHHDSTPLKVYAAGDHPPFYVQQTLIAGVSKKLADFCTAQTCLNGTEYEVLRIFLSWLVNRTLVDGSQTVLVQAWKFGAR